jgi:hypothetical protein
MARVLYIGIEPKLVDLTSMPDLDADKLWAGIEKELRRMEAAGYVARWCPVDLGETAEATVASALSGERFDCVVIGAGIRVGAAYFFLFEKLLNVVHANAPAAKICFNTRPTDTLEAVERWVRP